MQQINPQKHFSTSNPAELRPFSATSLPNPTLSTTTKPSYPKRLNSSNGRRANGTSNNSEPSSSPTPKLHLRSVSCASLGAWTPRQKRSSSSTTSEKTPTSPMTAMANCFLPLSRPFSSSLAENPVGKRGFSSSTRRQGTGMFRSLPMPRRFCSVASAGPE